MTQSDRILYYLNMGNQISSIEALEKFSCFRLASRISDLRKQGHNIQSKLVKKGKKYYSVYWLNKTPQLVLL